MVLRWHGYALRQAVRHLVLGARPRAEAQAPQRRFHVHGTRGSPPLSRIFEFLAVTVGTEPTDDQRHCVLPKARPQRKPTGGAQLFPKIGKFRGGQCADISD